LAGQHGEQSTMPIQDKPVRSAKIAEPFAAFFMMEDQSIVETAGALQHGTAAGAPSKYRHLIRYACALIDLPADLVRMSGDHEIPGGLPNPQYPLASFTFARLNQSFITSEIFRRISEA
jgi:hypothetical protein